MIHGLVVVAKEPGISSHQVVERIRRMFHIRKVGHFGTLDPSASGVLLIALGHATRLFDFYIDKRKRYQGTIRFGFATTTYDAEGEPLSEKKEFDLNQSDIEMLLAPYRGTIMQIPPLFSAKKFQGKPLYSYARKQIEITPAAVPVTIYALTGSAIDPTNLKIDVTVSSGTYIRSLAHDIGQRVGVGAHLYDLVRVEIGDFTLSSAFTLAEIEHHIGNTQPERVVIPIEALLPELSKIIVTPGGRRLVANGMSLGPADIMRIFPASHPEFFRIFDDEGKLLALAQKEIRSQTFRPTVVFPDS